MEKHFLKIVFALIMFACIAYAIKHPMRRSRNHYENQHVVLFFKNIPDDEHGHQLLNYKAFYVIQEINQALVDKGFISSNWTLSGLYNHRKNEVFITHFDYDLGHFTVYIPDTISYEQFIKIANPLFKKNSLPVHFSKDQRVQLAGPVTGFQGQAFDLHALEKYKNMTDVDFSVSQVSPEIRKEYQIVKPMKDLFFWHWQHPYIGLYKDASTLATLVSSYAAPLSWNFSLWELAPQQGKGITVTIIDTGVASFKIKGLEQAYKKNLNITMPNVFKHYGYNIVGFNGLDPIAQFVSSFGRLLNPYQCNYKELMYKTPEWIQNYLEKNETKDLKGYFKDHAREGYKDSNGQLNSHAERVFENFLHHNFTEGKNKDGSSFHLVNLDGTYNQSALLETLPTPKITANTSTVIAGHGTFTYGLIGAQQIEGKGLTGIAPQAKVLMIKAFDDEGESNKSTLNAALQRSLLLNTDIVSMSLKISNDIDENSEECRHLKMLVNAHDYVVAASGNDGEEISTEAYPARFESVAFDVGSFSYDPVQGFHVTNFTQTERGIGPKFAAPGFNIFGPGLLPNQNKDSIYMFMAGTSISAPIVTGFMALVLGEFKSIFSKEQLLKAIYSSSAKLGKSQDWGKVLLGVIDMRTSLLTLHILKEIKTKLDPALFTKKFNHLIRAIHTIIFERCAWYGKQVGLEIKQDLMGYAQKVKNIKNQVPQVSYQGDPTDLKSIITHCSSLLTKILQENSYVSDDLIKPLVDILHQEECDLFDFLVGSAKDRVQKAISAQYKVQDFWSKQVHNLKHGS